MNFRNKPRKKRSIIWTVPKEQFATLIENSKSFVEIFEFFNLPRNRWPGFYNTIYKRCESEGISFSHIEKYTGRQQPRKLADEDLFRKNSNSARISAKRRIIADKLLDYKCALCPVENIWNGKPIALVLDHINGIHNDHRIENLRFLCPNCNSQTETFSGRNKKYK